MWWLYSTFKSQDFRESIETCFGAALNIIDLQGLEPENKGAGTTLLLTFINHASCNMCVRVCVFNLVFCFEVCVHTLGDCATILAVQCMLTWDAHAILM